MRPRLTARHLLLAAAAAALSACASPVAPTDAPLRTDTNPASACGGVFGGVSTRCADSTTTINSTSTTTESTSLSGCGGVFGGVSTRCISDEDGEPTGN